MATEPKKQTAYRPRVQYTLQIVGGPADGKTVPADNAAAARAAYDMGITTASEIVVTKVVSRRCTRDEIAARPRKAKPTKQPLPAAAGKK